MTFTTPLEILYENKTVLKQAFLIFYIIPMTNIALLSFTVENCSLEIVRGTEKNCFILFGGNTRDCVGNFFLSFFFLGIWEADLYEGLYS